MAFYHASYGSSHLSHRSCRRKKSAGALAASADASLAAVDGAKHQKPSD